MNTRGCLNHFLISGNVFDAFGVRLHKWQASSLKTLVGTKTLRSSTKYKLTRAAASKSSPPQPWEFTATKKMMKIPKMPLFAIKQTVCSKHKRNSVQGCCVKKYLTDVNNSDPDTKRAMTAAERFASEQILKEL